MTAYERFSRATDGHDVVVRISAATLSELLDGRMSSESKESLAVEIETQLKARVQKVDV